MTSPLRQFALASLALFFGMLIALPVFAVPLTSEAAQYFDVSPKVVNAKSKAREISNFMLTLKNSSAAILPVYITIVDVDPEKGRTLASGADILATTPSRWFEVGRTQTLLPHEEQSVALRMSVPAQAKSGTYNVLMRLSTSNSPECSECAEEVPVTIDIADDAREVMQLSSFMTTKDIFTGDAADFKLRVSNTGNRALAPTGKIRIFDKRGNEVGSVNVNSDGKIVSPKAEDMLATTWAAGGHFGRYKALLDVSYGQRGVMQDTVYFWVVPWGKLTGLFMTIILVLGFAVLMMRGRGLANAYSYADGGEYHDAAFDEPYNDRARDNTPNQRERAIPFRETNPWGALVPARAREESAQQRPLGAVQLEGRKNSYADVVLEMRAPQIARGGEVSIAPRARPGAEHQVSLEKRTRHVRAEHQVRL